MKFSLQSFSIHQRIFILVSIVLIAGFFVADKSLGFFESAEGLWPPLTYAPVVLLAICCAYLIAWISVIHMARPLRQFIEGAREIGRGNFDHTIHITGHPEIVQLAKIFNYMTLELKRIHQMNINRIIQERIKTEAILRNIADGVIVTGAQGEILLINQVVEHWMNTDEKSVTGASISFFIPELKPLIDRVSAGDITQTQSEEIEITDQQTREPIVLSAHASSVRDEDQLIAVIIVLRNITREKAIDRMKTELVSVVAHELRSPLTSIAGFSEVLKDPELPESTRKEYTDIIHYESGRLAEMINKFLDISRIESGQTVMNKMPVEVQTIVFSVMNMNQHQFQKKNISVSTVMPESPVMIFADPHLMGQVMMNLFSNAIKYSPENTTIEVRVDTANQQVQLSVADQGYGISKENLPHIFKKFFRAKNDKRIKDIEGTGLGLAFVKEIIHQHNGQIAVESKPGKGTVFTIKMDLYLPPPDTEKPPSCTKSEK